MRTALVILLILSASAFGQSALRDEILALYPDGTSGPPSGTQLRSIRDYWNRAAKDPAPYVDVLREELRTPGRPPLFYVDGGLSLLLMSDTRENRSIVLRAILRADVPQVGLMSYYALVRRLALLNEDTSRAAFHLLEWPDLELGIKPGERYQIDNLVVSLVLPTDVQYWGDAAGERLDSEPDERAQQTLLRLLWYSQSDFADDQLRAFSSNPKKPLSSRLLAQQLLAQTPDESLATQSSEAELRQRLRDAGARMSVGELDRVARALMAKRAAERP